MVKNAFISPQKLFSFSRYLKFCLDFLVIQQNDLIRKILWQFWNILSNVSWSKGNQTTKLGLLIEYNIRNIFLEKLYTKCGGELVTDPFLES